MVGTYSSHRRRYVEDAALRYGHWYVESHTGALFIVPTIGLAEGPPGDKLDQLNTLYGAQALAEVNTDVIGKLTGLRPVHWEERQFDASKGYHIA